MGGVSDVLSWATGTIEGVAFVEYLILGGMLVLWRKLRGIERRLDAHEKVTSDSFAQGRTKFAVLEQTSSDIQDDIREIKDSLKR